MGFVANFIRFPAVQKFENQLRCDKVTESLKVGTFLRHSAQVTSAPPPCCPTNSISVVKLIATMLVQHKKVIVG